MRLFSVLLLAAFAPGMSPGQQAGQTQAGPGAEAPKAARIEGVVISLAGGPVPRATVRLTGQLTVVNGATSPGSAYSATTDDSGKFAIENIDPGRSYQLVAQRTGFVNGRYGARSATSPATPLVLEAGTSLKGISITMAPQGVISGKITDATGDPVQSVLVALMRRSYQRGVRQLVTMNTASSNDQGEYRIPGLPPGRYYLMANARNLDLNSVSVSQSNTTSIPTYYPNGTEPQGAAPLDIAVGQELRNVDIRLRQGKAFAIRGKVVGAGGAPVSGAILLALPKTSTNDAIAVLSLRSQTNTRPDGSFEMRGLTPGLYTIQAVSTQTGTTRGLGRIEVNVADADLTNVVLAASGGATINGTVRLEDGDIKSVLSANPAGAAQTNSAALAVAASAAGIAVSGVRLTIALTEATPQPIAATPPAQVKDDGTFVFESVTPSQFQLNVAALPQGMVVKSARFGGADITSTGIDLTSGGGGNLEILLSNKAADVKGSVTPVKDDSVAGMMVTLWTRDPEPGNANNGIRTATTDQNGGFQFQGLRSGIYYAAAWEDIDTGLAQARDFLNLLTSDATKVDLAEGAHSSPQVKIVPIAKIKATEEKLP